MEHDWMKETMKKIKDSKPKVAPALPEIKIDTKFIDSQIKTYQKLIELNSIEQERQADILYELEERVNHLETRPPLFPAYGFVLCLGLLGAALAIKFGVFL
jgi:hypothetical protein